MISMNADGWIVLALLAAFLISLFMLRRRRG